MFLFCLTVDTPLSMIFILALTALPTGSSFVHDVGKSSRLTMIGGELRFAKKNPLEQIKLDFLGSLDNPYDLNPKNPATESFLARLVEQVSSGEQYNTRLKPRMMALKAITVLPSRI